MLASTERSTNLTCTNFFLHQHYIMKKWFNKNNFTVYFSLDTLRIKTWHQNSTAFVLFPNYFKIDRAFIGFYILSKLFDNNSRFVCAPPKPTNRDITEKPENVRLKSTYYQQYLDCVISLFCVFFSASDSF